jgi:hypothetical protein
MTIEAPRKTFWSRRRDAVRAEAEAEAAALASARQAAELAEVEHRQAARSDDEILEELGLQDPDLMQMGDDFARFMDKAVPERLRQRALRRLWRSNPVLANLDGLVDYGDDFTDAAMVVPDMKTAYQVGRGMMRHVIALAEAAEAEKAAAEKAAADLVAGDVAGQPGDAGAAPEPEAAKPDAVEPDAVVIADAGEPARRDLAPSPDAHADDTGFQTLRPRHMRFSFAD